MVPRVEVADIFRRHAPAFRETHAVNRTQRRVIGSIVACRTAKLGGHTESCDHCGLERIAYNSCRNRHCPKCQSLPRALWVEKRKAELLPVPYFHVVFTLPEFLRTVALHHPAVVYDILFRASATTLQQVSANPKHLGARIGFMSVLHTWNQQLQYHPHIHCVVPGGGLADNATRWVAARPRFFLPVKVLSMVYRGVFLDLLRRAHVDGDLSHIDDLEALLRPAYRHEWVVYAKPPFAGPAAVIEYLGNYTHRVAISNHRIVDANDTGVTIRWKNRRLNLNSTLTLTPHEFMRRFLLHVLPKGFVRLRHYGFMANSRRHTSITRCRELLNVPSVPGLELIGAIPWRTVLEALTGRIVDLCPRCETGRLKPSPFHTSDARTPTTQTPPHHVDTS